MEPMKAWSKPNPRTTSDDARHVWQPDTFNVVKGPEWRRHTDKQKRERERERVSFHQRNTARDTSHNQSNTRTRPRKREATATGYQDSSVQNIAQGASLKEEDHGRQEPGQEDGYWEQVVVGSEVQSQRHRHPDHDNESKNLSKKTPWKRR